MGIRSLFLFTMKQNHITNQLKRREWERKKMALKGKQETKTIGEVEFIFQHPGIEEVLDLKERSRGENGHLSDKELAKELFEHVIIAKVDDSPQKVNFAFFEEKFGGMKEYKEIIKAAAAFLFR